VICSFLGRPSGSTWAFSPRPRSFSKSKSRWRWWGRSRLSSACRQWLWRKLCRNETFPRLLKGRCEPSRPYSCSVRIVPCHTLGVKCEMCAHDSKGRNESMRLDAEEPDLFRCGMRRTGGLMFILHGMNGINSEETPCINAHTDTST